MNCMSRPPCQSGTAQVTLASPFEIADILHMSSGLRFRGVADPDLDVSLGYPDHLYVYTGGVSSFECAAIRPPQWPPNTIGRYRNSDPVLTNYLVRLGAEGWGDEYLSFPQRELFDKIGIRGMVLCAARTVSSSRPR